MKQAMFLSLLLLCSASALIAQDVTASTSNDHAGDAAVHVTLGPSVVALNGPWKFHVGDNPQWADPNFDDSNWESYDLAPGIQNLQPAQALQMPELPGWQHHGHPHYAGYGWYRIHLSFGSNSGPIALLMPQHSEDAWEVYLNGRLIGRYGKLDGFHLTYDARPQLLHIPTATLNISKPAALAIRFWSMPWEAFSGGPNLYGGLRGVPLAGPAALLQIFDQSVPEPDPGWNLQTAIFGYFVQPFLYVGIGLISVFLFLFSKGQREYLWAGIALLGRGILIGAIFMEEANQISQQLGAVTQQVALWASVLSMPLAAMWLLSVPRWRWRWANALVFGLFCAQGFASIGNLFGWAPPNAAVSLIVATLQWMPRTALGLMLLLITYDGVRAIGQKAWVLLIPGILFAGHMLVYMFVVDFSTSIGTVDQLLSAGVPVSVLFIFLIRFKEQQRDNGRLLDDMRQAQEVQSLLIPRQAQEVPGWLIESEYRPARQVGGDFFQILPGSDGSLLIVVGDVSGKGLQAAMTVSAIIGALRDSDERQPAQVLAHLNRVLCGQISGFATSCATLISENGSMTIANAGHLSPYRNGEEVPLPSGLPLGLVPDASYEEARFELTSGDCLTFLSDGVVEARNAKGELLGFERLAPLTTKPAAEIADAAQRWGQEDDITVLTVARVAKLEAVTA
jgi:Stage II sporulation protein E (SpoIIE)